MPDCKRYFSAPAKFHQNQAVSLALSVFGVFVPLIPHCFCLNDAYLKALLFMRISCLIKNRNHHIWVWCSLKFQRQMHGKSPFVSWPVRRSTPFGLRILPGGFPSLFSLRLTNHNLCMLTDIVVIWRQNQPLRQIQYPPKYNL